MSHENGDSGVSKAVLEAFDAMWGLYPAPVLLLKANREIVAVNDEGRTLGIPVGIKCFQLSGKDRVCEGCLANSALKEGLGKREVSWQEKMNMLADSYWIPVRGASDLYVHFANNITAYAKDELCR